MKKAFNELYKLLKVGEDTVVGYSDSHFILATELKPDCSFKRLEKDMYILEEFKDQKYRYLYVTETEILKSAAKKKI